MVRYFEIATTYKEKCEYCRCIVEKHIEQYFEMVPDFGWAICYEAGYFCECCGTVSEPFGLYKTPKQLREILIKEHGLWSLDIGKALENREKLLAMFVKLRRRINFRALRQFPPLHGIVAEGTFVEMKYLQLNFEDIGIPTMISKKQ